LQKFTPPTGAAFGAEQQYRVQKQKQKIAHQARVNSQNCAHLSWKVVMLLRPVTARAAPQLEFARDPRAAATAPAPTLMIAAFRDIVVLR